MPVVPPDFHQWSNLKGKLEVKPMLSFLINNKIKHLNSKEMIKSQEKQIRVETWKTSKDIFMFILFTYESGTLKMFLTFFY